MPREYQNSSLEKITSIIRESVDPGFDFVRPGPSPWYPSGNQTGQGKIALVTTAGLHLKTDSPFRAAEDPFGDTSYRWVPQGTPPSRFDLLAPYVDQRYIPRDTEVAFPQLALAEENTQGGSGPPSSRHASFSGGIIHPLPGLKDSAATMAESFLADGVEQVVLIPSCPLCVQTVCLVARELEERRLCTVCITLVPELSRMVGAPRTLEVKFPFGAPCGDPGNRSLHRALLREALAWIKEAPGPGAHRISSLHWRQTFP